jgi:MFS family permease
LTNRWTILAVLFFARLTMAFQFQAVAALAPLVATRYGVGLADIGLLIGLYLAPGIALALPGGALATRLGERRVVIASLGMMLVGGGLMWAGTGWEMLVAGRVLAGIGGVAVNVLLTKMLADWFVGQEISTAMAIYVVSWPLGIALALLVLPSLAAAGGLSAAFAAVPVLIAIGLVVFLLLYRPPETGGAAVTLSAASLPLAPVLAAGWIWAFYNGAIAMVFSFGPVLLIARGWTLETGSSATSLYLLLMAISIPLGGILADRSGRRDTVIAVSLAGFALLMAATLLVPVGWIPAVFVAMGLVSGLCAGPVMGLPAAVLPPATRAFGMGVFFTLYYVVMMLAPMLAGWLADLSGDPATPFVLGIGLLISCLGALLLFRATAAPALAPR